VRENLRFYSELYGMIGAEGRERRAQVLKEFGLDQRAGQLAGTLSGGWKQRLALACATAHDPVLVFLDEPTAGVDPAARQHFWTIIDERARAGLTVLVTTHYMDEAERCDRLGLLSRGDLIALGTPAHIKQQFGMASIEDVFISLQRQDEGALT
jgi:ABC-2 type transport system ATP-binding protein